MSHHLQDPRDPDTASHSGQNGHLMPCRDHSVIIATFGAIWCYTAASERLASQHGLQSRCDFANGTRESHGAVAARRCIDQLGAQIQAGKKLCQKSANLAPPERGRFTEICRSYSRRFCRNHQNLYIPSRCRQSVIHDRYPMTYGSVGSFFRILWAHRMLWDTLSIAPPAPPASLGSIFSPL